MPCPKHVYLLMVLPFSLSVAACNFSTNNDIPQSAIEATVVAQVEATVIANAVSIEQRVQATVSAILAATQTAVALLPTNTPTSVPTQVATPTPTIVSTEAPPTDTPQPTPTPTSPAITYRVASNANLRSGPGTGFPVIGARRAGDSVQLIARTEDSEWFQVATETEDQAWIAAFLIESLPDLVSIPIAASIPVAPTSAPISQQTTVQPVAQSSGQRLNVSFINPHYNCNRDKQNAFYRYFQVDFFINNTSSEPIIAKWEPTRWVITDGNQTRTDTEMGEWYHRQTGFYEQPDIPPGGSEGWTFVALRVELSEWVQAVEWEYQGQLYRQEFENNAINRAEWNYRACP